MPDPSADFIALAFDYGTRKIGVAVGQSVTGTATALPVLPARDGVPDWAAVEKLIGEWQPRVLVVGLPLNMDGSESELSRRARKFANRLRGRFSIAVEMIDERLSTRSARDFADAGDRRLDSHAAALVLESWLAEQSRTGRDD